MFLRNLSFPAPERIDSVLRVVRAWIVAQASRMRWLAGLKSLDSLGESVPAKVHSRNGWQQS